MMGSCVIGIGSPHGDDQAGWLICDLLQPHLDPRIKIAKVASPIDVLDHFDAADCIWLCDGCRSLSKPGSLHRWVWPDPEIALCRFGGTHDLDLASALKLGERLGKLPPHVVIWGIDIQSVDPVAEISPDVRAAVANVVREIQAEIDQARIPQYA